MIVKLALARQPDCDLSSLYQATEEELASARRRVAEADELLGQARQGLTQAILARGYLFPELHDDTRGGL